MSSLQGKVIVFAGTLNTKRAEVKTMAVAAGAKVSTTITGKTDMVVLGRAPGKKKAEAEAKNLLIWDESQFLAACSNSGGAQVDSSSTKKRKAPVGTQPAVKKVKEEKKKKAAVKRKAPVVSESHRKKMKIEETVVLKDILGLTESPLENWGSSKPLNEWEGVTIGSNGLVSKLNLSEKIFKSEFE